jgi:hypothetical protein
MIKPLNRLFGADAYEVAGLVLVTSGGPYISYDQRPMLSGQPGFEEGLDASCQVERGIAKRSGVVLRQVLDGTSKKVEAVVDDLPINLSHRPTILAFERCHASQRDMDCMAQDICAASLSAEGRRRL